jgi:uncharacterized OsmC-like protein
MSTSLTVRHAGGDRFTTEVRGHRITTDQPADAGGHDSAPTPTELFVAGLASCVAHYARRYCARHDIDPIGLVVESSFDIGGRPARIERIDVRVTPPPALPAERLDAFLAVASGCTVHNTLAHPPTPTVELARAAERQPVS